MCCIVKPIRSICSRLFRRSKKISPCIPMEETRFEAPTYDGILPWSHFKLDPICPTKQDTPKECVVRLRRKKILEISTVSSDTFPVENESYASLAVQKDQSQSMDSSHISTESLEDDKEQSQSMDSNNISTESLAADETHMDLIDFESLDSNPTGKILEISSTPNRNLQSIKFFQNLESTDTTPVDMESFFNEDMENSNPADTMKIYEILSGPTDISDDLDPEEEVEACVINCIEAVHFALKGLHQDDLRICFAREEEKAYGVRYDSDEYGSRTSVFYDEGEIAYSTCSEDRDVSQFEGWQKWN